MIEIQGLRKDFQIKEGIVAALQNIDLTIAAEEFFVLLGPSGSGKSTLLRCLAGIEDPDAGTMIIGNQKIYSSALNVRIPPERRGLGMVFQSYAVWPHLSVYDNVALPLRHGANRIDANKVKSQVMEALAMVQLEQFADRPVPFLSGGQQQRVALARALAIRPKVMLMDEPLSNLDARLREEVRHEIRKITREVGVTVVYVTHDQSEALALADRIAVMHQGQIIQIGNPEEIYFTPKSSLVADFFGEMNWFEGTANETGMTTTSLGDIQTQAKIQGPVKLGIRPTHIMISAEQTHLENEFAGLVMDEVFLGEQVQYTIKTANGTILNAKLHKRGRGRNLGQSLWCRLDKADLLVYPHTP